MIVAEIAALAVPEFAIGAAIGWFGRRKLSARPGPAPPICTCKHGFGMHDGEGCQAADRQDVRRYDQHRGSTYWEHEWMPCRCKGYDGPPAYVL